MSPREQEGRQLIAGLAEFLRSGEYPAEAMAHLAAVGNMVREKEFSKVDGKGEIIIPVEMFLRVSMGPAGLKVAPPPPTAADLIVKRKGAG